MAFIELFASGATLADSGVKYWQFMILMRM